MATSQKQQIFALLASTDKVPPIFPSDFCSSPAVSSKIPSAECPQNDEYFLEYYSIHKKTLDGDKVERKESF